MTNRCKLWARTLFALLTCCLLAGIVNAQDCGGDWENCEVTPSFESKVSITNAGYWKVITANGIPNHTIGIFGRSGIPDPDCGRPFDLEEQDYTFVMPAYSAEGELWPETVFWVPQPPFEGKPETTFGVAVNGVPFDPVAAEWWDPITSSVVPLPTDWHVNILRNEEMKYDLDCNTGHVQPDGAYHYHGFPHGLYEKVVAEQSVAVLPDSTPDELIRARAAIVLLGWAFDGNPIYGEQCGRDALEVNMVNAKSSHKLRTSATVPPARTDAADPKVSEFSLGNFSEDYWFDDALFKANPAEQLDECNGHTGPTPEFVNGVYHYHILEKTNSLTDIGFPYIGRCYRLFTYGQGPNIFPKPR